MTPKEKAKQLVEKYLYQVRGADRYSYNLDDINMFIAKQCAQIAANEVLEALNPSQLEDIFYWSEVKTEIENL